MSISQSDLHLSYWKYLMIKVRNWGLTFYINITWPLCHHSFIILEDEFWLQFFFLWRKCYSHFSVNQKCFPKGFRYIFPLVVPIFTWLDFYFIANQFFIKEFLFIKYNVCLNKRLYGWIVDIVYFSHIIYCCWDLNTNTFSE